MLNLITEMIQVVKTSWHRDPVVPSPYYQLQINNHNTRTSNTVTFDTLSDAMSYVNQAYLMYQPLVDIFLIHVKYDGPNSIIRLNAATQNVLEDRQCLYRVKEQDKGLPQ